MKLILIVFLVTLLCYLATSEKCPACKDEKILSEDKDCIEYEWIEVDEEGESLKKIDEPSEEDEGRFSGSLDVQSEDGIHPKSSPAGGWWWKTLIGLGVASLGLISTAAVVVVVVVVVLKRKYRRDEYNVFEQNKKSLSKFGQALIEATKEYSDDDSSEDVYHPMTDQENSQINQSGPTAELDSEESGFESDTYVE